MSKGNAVPQIQMKPQTAATGDIDANALETTLLAQLGGTLASANNLFAQIQLLRKMRSMAEVPAAKTQGAAGD